MSVRVAQPVPPRSFKQPADGAPLLVCGGGTGGHVYPALAVAAELSDRRLVYVGSHDGMEAGLVARESNLPFRGLPAAAIRGRGPLTMARNALVLATGTLAALRLLRELRPAAILGTGGYVCVPLFAAARLARIPTVIYLPDVVPGLAVRTLARLATVVACNVEDSARYLQLPIYDLRLNQDSTTAQAATNLIENVQGPFVNGKIVNGKIANHALVVTGYPVRRELFEQDRQTCRAAFQLDDPAPVLLVYGGSRGARSINRAVQALLPELLSIAQIIHVCGREGDETWLRAAEAALPAQLRRRYRLFPYLHGEGEGGPTMLQAFGAADLALCRSGASTLAELPAAGLAAVLVPYPFVHQEENADYLVRHGAAVKVLDAQLPDTAAAGGILLGQLRRLLEQGDERQAMAQRSKVLARPDAAAQLAAIVVQLASDRGKIR